MTYVDGYIIPIPKKNVKAYRAIAKKTGKIWREHGALDYKETVADQLTVPDMQGKKVKPFPKMVKLKPSETLVFSYVLYKSRAHRDAVNKKVMKDPRMAEMMSDDAMPFDPKRMAFGGFKVIVDA